MDEEAGGDYTAAPNEEDDAADESEAASQAPDPRGAFKVGEGRHGDRLPPLIPPPPPPNVSEET